MELILHIQSMLIRVTFFNRWLQVTLEPDNTKWVGFTNTIQSLCAPWCEQLRTPGWTKHRWMPPHPYSRAWAAGGTAEALFACLPLCHMCMSLHWSPVDNRTFSICFQPCQVKWGCLFWHREFGPGGGGARLGGLRNHRDSSCQGIFSRNVLHGLVRTCICYMRKHPIYSYLSAYDESPN